jgi:hypothetical protein
LDEQRSDIMRNVRLALDTDVVDGRVAQSDWSIGCHHLRFGIEPCAAARGDQED